MRVQVHGGGPRGATDMDSGAHGAVPSLPVDIIATVLSHASLYTIGCATLVQESSVANCIRVRYAYHTLPNLLEFLHCAAGNANDVSKSKVSLSTC